MMRYDYSCMRAFLGEIDEASPTPAARENKRRDMAADMQHRRPTPNTGPPQGGLGGQTWTWIGSIHGLDWTGGMTVTSLKNF